MNTDQNLLFGVLALELELIDVQQFAELCCTWAAHKEKGLAELLVERNWISAEERSEVQRLMDRKLHRKQGDVRQALSDAAGPQLRDVMRGVGDAAVEQTLSQLEPVPGFVRVSETAELAQGEISHYTLSRVQDQGGLGRVWLAFDKNLCRDVALKEIRPDKQPTDQSLRRFVREAQITGQLEHPNIVPVYELARDQDRTYPFYTMRFVHGQSLGDAIEAYHKQRRAGAAAGLEFRRLLQAVVNVCHAIAYAHSRRVIHRDLKPSNVMLGKYGEVIVLDWGLAKLLDRPEELPQEEQPVARWDAAAGVETQPGQVLGTPAYMAPEQALGKHAEVDALTDIYGLGSILYRLLTGHRPHQGRDSQERMRRAAEDPTPQPRAVDPRVPRALDAICRKAMSRNRMDRYLSATALADDVQRWLGDEPVSTYRDPWYVRAGRWARRHRQLAAAIAAAVALTAISATTAAVFIDHARQVAGAARAREVEARQAAFGWFQKAQQTIDLMATGVSNVLQNLPGTDRLRVQLLETAASSYEEFSGQASQDPQVRLERAHTLVRLGDIRRRIGEYPKAAQAYEDARRAYGELAGAPLGEHDVQLDLAFCSRKLGDLCLDQRDYAGARKVLAEARKQLDRARNSSDRSRQEIEWKISLGLLEREGKNLAQAEHWFREALTQAVAANSADEPKPLEQRALIRSLLGGVLSDRGSHQEAIGFLKEALVDHQRLTGFPSSQPSDWEGLAFTELSLARALMPLGQCNEQADFLERAVRHYDGLLQNVAVLPHLRRNRAIALAHLGLLHHAAHRNQKARQLMDDAVVELARLADAPTAGVGEFEPLANAHTIRGRILRDLAVDDEAEKDFGNSLHLFVEELIPLESQATEEQWVEFRRSVAACGRHYTVLLERLGHDQEVEQEFDTALRLLEDALKVEPQNPRVLDEMAFWNESRGDFHRRKQAAQLASEAYRQALAVRRQLPDEPEYLARRIRVLLKLGGPSDLEQAAADAEKLVQFQPKHAGYQTLKAHVDFRRDQCDACLRTLDALPPDDLTSPGAERLFLLAMARHKRKQGDDWERAKESLEQALKLMQQESPGDVLMAELRDEAARLLGVPSTTKAERAAAETDPPDPEDRPPPEPLSKGKPTVDAD